MRDDGFATQKRQDQVLSSDHFFQTPIAQWIGKELIRLDAAGNPVITDSRTTSQGAYMGDMASALRNQGLSDARISNNVTIEQLATATANGNPAIVATSLARGGHAIVVDGITVRQGQRVVAIRDPAGGVNISRPLRSFNRDLPGKLFSPILVFE